MYKFPKAINQDSYTYELEGIYPNSIAAQSQFNELKRTDKLCEDSKYRTLKKYDEVALYIWY